LISKHSYLSILICALAVISGLMTASCTSPDPWRSFVIITDPHLSGDPDHEKRLSDCVDWINTHKESEHIELVFVIGDIAWEDDHLAQAMNILDGLTIPYVPIIGDNELHADDEEEFNAVFDPHYSYLSTVLDNWHKQPTPVWNPETKDYSYLQNFSFDFMGLHFVCLDWCTRFLEGLKGEQADLHDFTGGTWPWFKQDIIDCDKGKDNNIVMLSHHPMHVTPIIDLELGAFGVEENATIEAFTSDYGENIYANFAGHYHIGWREFRELGQYQVHVIEATHIGRNTMQLVHYQSDEGSFVYRHESVVVPTVD
ncbi:MAG: metallophosphoesterase, partial [Chloroflexota bacterium]|nr:metallophosphoesterase [Chloroflexota bacterium]